MERVFCVFHFILHEERNLIAVYRNKDDAYAFAKKENHCLREVGANMDHEYFEVESFDLN